MITQRPVAERISQWGSATEIIYQCPFCGTSFNFYGAEEKYCHSCGRKNVWTGLPVYAAKEFAAEYHASDCHKQKKMMGILNEVLKSAGNETVKQL